MPSSPAPSSLLPAALESAEDAVFLVDPAGGVIWANRSFDEAFGGSDGLLPDLWWPSQAGRAAHRRLAAALDRAEPIRREVRCHPDNSQPQVFDVRLTPRDEGGYVGVARNVTERTRAEERLRHAAWHDPLTGLPNRTLLEDRLAQAVAMALRDARTPGRKAAIAVMFVDMDGFKQINDSLGHGAGDDVLRALAAVLRETVRAGDTVSRVGGDEFVVLLREIAGAGDAAVVAAKLVAAMSAPLEIPGHVVSLSPSIGVAIHPEHGTDPKTLLHRADAAMYHVKRHGKGAWAAWEPAHDVPASPTGLSMADLVREALASDGLEVALHTQQRVDGTARASVDVHHRWRDSRLAHADPDALGQALDDDGLAERLLDRLLTGAWAATPPELRVVLEVSRPSMLSGMLRTLRDRAIAHGRPLGLRVPEAVLAEAPLGTRVLMTDLAESGVWLCASELTLTRISLHELRVLPLDALSLGSGASAALEAGRPIVRALTALGHSLGVEVICPGVDRAALRGRLRDAGCDLFTGTLAGITVVPGGAIPSAAGDRAS